MASLRLRGRVEKNGSSPNSGNGAKHTGLKGLNISAQGNALGNVNTHDL
jgi:hypothetical protein